MLSSKKILDLVGRRGSLARGAAMAMNERTGIGVSPHSETQRRFLEDFTGRQKQYTEAIPRPYAHPAHVNAYARKPGPLTASELAWINRLPEDPTKVSFEDARVLAGIATTIKRIENPADALIVDRVWRPIKEMHDRNAAKARLETARVQPPQISNLTFEALAESVAAENDQLTEDEALSRASDLLREVREAQARSRQQEIEHAEQAVAAVDLAEHARTTVTL